MTKDDRPVSEVADLIAQLAIKRGLTPLYRHPGLVEMSAGGSDNKFVIWANGHRTPLQSESTPEVPPYHFYIEYNGLPAGLIHPYEGTMLRGLEDSLIAVLQLELED